MLALPPDSRGQRTFQCFDCDQPDLRNAKAAQRLLELESQIEIPDNVWKAIAPFSHHF
jgi:hypothetical protein